VGAGFGAYDTHLDQAQPVDGVSVVNGCQSLIALYSKRTSVTPDLKLVTKVVQLGDETGLADKTTYRSNTRIQSTSVISAPTTASSATSKPR